ncbi:general odorant-binding protein 56d-like [Hylaeus volcanicus]|uniref:general odorant-binding protein 56d-like n=1 Tax=Hylaeus volcanicus TaxID=313075 RepID=UPI0023B7E6C7|nr:general odorant-binding protein 56d-like [Hylaeus volcanicus]XP_053976851.1 general odorant-binding protein 56d-like [Hylaeus volcanicus]
MFGYRSFFWVLTAILILLEPVVTDIRRDCRKETRVSWVALRRMKSGDFEQNDPRLKCYLKCFMARNGILDGNAEIDVQRALRHLPRSLQHSSKKLFNECKSIPGTDHCDKAFQIVKCYVKYHPEILHSVPFL